MDTKKAFYLLGFALLLGLGGTACQAVAQERTVTTLPPSPTESRVAVVGPTADVLPMQTTQTSPSPSPTASPTPGLVPNTSNTKPEQNEISPWPTPVHSIFSAEITDGPFIFDLRLIQDPKFSQAPSMPWMYSDLPGYGSSLVWVYHGSGIRGEGEVYWGVGTNLNALGGFDQLREGENGGREGGRNSVAQPAQTWG